MTRFSAIAAIAASAAFGLLVPLRAIAALDPAQPLELVVQARVADETGSPIPGARVTAEGGRGASALTGDDGRCTFRVPLGAAHDLAAHPVTLALRAQAGGRRVAFVDGSDALRLEIAIGGAQVRVRSNDLSLPLVIAGALREGAAAGIPCEAHFFSIPAGAPAPAKARLSTTVEAPVEILTAPAARATPTSTAKPEPPGPATQSSAAKPEPPGPATQASGAKPEPAPRTSVAKIDARPVAPPAAKPTSVPSRATPKPAPRDSNTAPPVTGTSGQTTRTMQHVISTATSEVPVLTPSRLPPRDQGPCVCNVMGAVEVDSDHPLPRPVLVVVALFDQPALRDTIRLDMGSPRAFMIRGVPCGSHRVQVQIPGGAGLALATPESALLFECDREGPRPLSIVLKPR